MHASSCARAFHLLALTGLFVTFAAPGCADDADPPERIAVADLVEGSVAAQFAGASEWTADLSNRPLTSGDKVWVDANSRAELHLGSTAIRLGSNTGLQFLNVADNLTQLRLSAGSMNVRLRYLSPDEAVEVDTPNSAISLLQAGEYRIDVSDAGDAVRVAVWRGQAEVAGQSQSFTLQQQEFGEFHGSDTLDPEFSDLPAADTLDQWSQNLDQREDESLTANFVSRDMSGYTDMDGTGDWQTDPDYGELWYPPVVAGWAPYSQGCWVWIAPWGWTWIDEAPWGFVPFHYGRWIHGRHGWGWSPGQLAVRPVYSPALVAWETGPNSTIAWFPLGYNEIYRPPMHVSSGYLRRVNVSNTYIDGTVSLDGKNMTRAPHYANQSVPGALIAVSAETFTAARPVNRELKPIAANALVVATVNPLSPTPKSGLRAESASRAAAHLPPARMFSRTIVARSLPPARERHGVGEQSRLILTHVQRAPATPRSFSISGAPRPASERSPVQPAPARADAPPARTSQPPRESSPPAVDDRPAHALPPAQEHSDRPPLMPHAAPERPAVAPQRTPPVVERAPPPAENPDRNRTERPATEPAVKKETPPPAAPRKPPDRSPQNSNR